MYAHGCEMDPANPFVCDLSQEALTAFMEDIISHMAGYAPLKAIAERILTSYASDPFGDFKASPSSLLQL